MRNVSDKILIIGGDRRFDAAAECLAEKYSVSRCFGSEKDFDKLAKENGIFLLPIPYTADGRTVYQSGGTATLPLTELFSAFRSDVTVFCGKADDEIRKAAAEKGALLCDYGEEETLAVKNAIPTAEGAIALALDLLPVTLHGAGVLVLGFGRIGKMLAKILFGFGARVTVAARKPSDLALADAFGYTAVSFDCLKDAASKQEVIFNTVPAIVMTKGVLDVIPTGTVVIDLASNPGGVDRIAADARGIRSVRALALPGKCAPVSAGRYVAETVIRLLSRKEETE